MKTWMIVLGAALALGLVVLLVLPFGDERNGATPAGAAATSPPAAGAAEELPELPAEAAALESPVDGVIADGEYPHSVEVTGMTVYWGNDAENLRMGLVSPGTGYVSVGLAPDRRMEGANFILGAVVDGWAAVRDDIGTGPVAHEADIERGGTDDVLEWGGSETEGATVFEFVIPLDSGDAQDKPLVPGEVYELLVAYHETSDDFSARHSARGAAEITLDPAP
ncbi:MAG: hypothetical protein JSW65_05515 [Candidatus Bipolaricaulota bacterium]|nr:MAG: hypothetical protein JSW65_05515 [Candidatus Bipolaricaulota bacterium]